MGAGDGDRDKNRYEEAMKASNGDEVKAKEYAAKKFGGNTDSYWDKAKAGAQADQKERSNSRYIEYVRLNGKTDSKETRAQFDALEKSEKGSAYGSKKTSFAPKDIQDAILNAATSYGIDPKLMMKMAVVESGMNPNAVSPTGAKGLYQFVSGTGASFGLKTDADYFNPYSNAIAGAQYMKQNMVALQSKGIPISELSLYLAHQLGAGGSIEVWKAAMGKGELSEARMKAMALNNPGLDAGQLKNPKLFISAWDKKLGANTNPFGDMTAQTAGVKQDKRIAAVNSGSPAVAASKTLAAAGAPSSNAVTTPSKAAAATPAKSETIAAATATPKVGGGNAVAGASPSVSNKDGLATVAASESMHEKYNAGVGIAAASGNNTESALLQELRKANTALSAIAGNTKDMQTNIATSVVEATKVAISSANAATSNPKPQGADARMAAVTRVSTDLFGNLARSGGGPVPSKDAMRIASGLNMG
jgi:hypothetical protein